MAKASGKVCTRVPHQSRPGRRRTRVWDVDATTGAICELGEYLAGERIEKVTLESTSDYWRIWLRREAPCCIPGLAGRNLEDIPGSDGLLKIRGSRDSRNVRFPCTSRVRHRTTSYSTGRPRCPHSGHRSRVPSSGPAR